jgi:hypothetical protein
MSDEDKLNWSNVKSLHDERFVELKKSNFDVDNLHPEARRRLQMLGFLTVDVKGDYQELNDDDIDSLLLKIRHHENPDILADKYMMHHGLYDLFKVIDQ